MQLLIRLELYSNARPGLKTTSIWIDLQGRLLCCYQIVYKVAEFLPYFATLSMILMKYTHIEQC